jgi:hypothetical protein
MCPTEKSVIIRSLDVKKIYKSVDERVVTRCHRINKMMQEDDLGENEYSDRLDEMIVHCENKDEKLGVKIISSLVYTFLNNNSKKEPELNLILEILRPFILNCIAFKTKGIKTEWYILYVYIMVNFNH